MSLTWSTPRFLECSGQGESQSISKRQPTHTYGHEQEGTYGDIRGQEPRFPSAAPSSLNMVVEPSIAQPSNMALSLTQSSHSHAVPEGRSSRASSSPARHNYGMCYTASQAKASCMASAPAWLPSAVAKPDLLASVPARRHHSTGQKLMMESPLAYPDSAKQAGQRSRAHSEPGFTHDSSVHATSEQWGGSAGGATSARGKSRSAAISAAARSSSITDSGSAANATQALMQVCTYLNVSMVLDSSRE